MGSYSPPSSAAPVPLLQEFSFEQADEIDITEESASPKKLKTIQIRDIPVDADGSPLDVLVVITVISALAHSDGAVTLNFQWSSYVADGARLNSINPTLTVISATYRVRGSGAASIQAQNNDPNPGLDIVLDAFLDGAGAGALKNIKATISMLIPQGATVTEV